MPPWNERRSQAYERIVDALPEAGELFRYMHKSLSVEYAFSELLEVLQSYLKCHRSDTGGLQNLVITEDMELPRASFATREIAGDLIKSLHSYDEFLRKFGGWAIASEKDFIKLDILRNHLEHALIPLPMCYKPKSRVSPPNWDLVLDLVALIAELKITGTLMDSPRIDKLEEFSEDGIINLTADFEAVVVNATNEYAGISKDMNSEAEKSIKKLSKLVAGKVAGRREVKTMNDIIKFYIGENAERERLAKENEKTISRLTK